MPATPTVDRVAIGFKESPSAAISPYSPSRHRRGKGRRTLGTWASRSSPALNVSRGLPVPGRWSASIYHGSVPGRPGRGRAGNAAVPPAPFEVRYAKLFDQGCCTPGRHLRRHGITRSPLKRSAPSIQLEVQGGHEMFDLQLFKPLVSTNESLVFEHKHLQCVLDG